MTAYKSSKEDVTNDYIYSKYSIILYTLIMMYANIMVR